MLRVAGERAVRGVSFGGVAGLWGRCPRVTSADVRSAGACRERRMNVTEDGSAIQDTPIDGLLVIRLKQVEDARGTVREFYRSSAWAVDERVSPIAGPWLQVNVTETRRGAVRGLHGEAMNKIVGVVSGQAMGVYLDARPGSPSYGAVHTCQLVKGVQVFVPRGVCNGFQSFSDDTQYLYCFDQEWRPGMPGVAFTPLSPDLNIAWPIPVDPNDSSQISAKDRDAPLWSSKQR